ncbi:Bug family tripartite tricarboxylate transporter substrate binding protein [Pseudorhodobacter sp. W20_MBD10_FR17]|uniref:Bug family tripartite tricarboxylate transporter substrate binding protein n=1 Tax=Pseudorhodobacter sp. W20_MBD10_FR17 TaxID=3240266 RepID=UPI003F9D2560
MTPIIKFIQKLMFTAALAAGIASLPLSATAQDYPTKAITMIAPTGPGSIVDILARLIGEGMTEQWGQQVIVKNVGGAGGAIGIGQIASAEADGYTLGFVPANLTTLPYLYQISYNVETDVVPVVRVAGASMVHYVNKDLGITSEAEFIKYATDHPGEVTFATAGEASAANLAAKLFQTKTGIEMTAIPYEKLNLGVLDVVAGRVSTVFVSAGQGMQFVKDGQLTALGVTGLTPNPGAPDLAPIADLGVAGYEYNSWFGIIAPAGTPRDIIDRLNAEITRQSQTPAFQQALAKAGLEPIVGTPEDFAAVIKAEVADWAGILAK